MNTEIFGKVKDLEKSINELFDEAENIVPSTTAEEIWNILRKLKNDNEK